MEHAVSLIWCVPASSDSPSHTSLTAEVCVCVCVCVCPVDYRLILGPDGIAGFPALI